MKWPEAFFYSVLLVLALPIWLPLLAVFAIVCTFLIVKDMLRW